MVETDKGLRMPGTDKHKRNGGSGIDRTWQLMGTERPEWEKEHRQSLGLQPEWLSAVTED